MSGLRELCPSGVHSTAGDLRGASAPGRGLSTSAPAQISAPLKPKAVPARSAQKEGRPQAGAAKSLDNLASSVSPEELKGYAGPASSRARRLSLRRLAGKILPRERVSKCGHSALGPNVTVHQTAAGLHFGGLETCGSVWHCPVCAAKIAEGRRKELETLMKAHAAGGGDVYMMTLTVPHHRYQSCKELRTAVSATWRKVKQGSPWMKARKRCKYLGDVRALEVTHGGNGWHPHLHVLLFFKPSASTDEQEYLGEWFFERWARFVERAGFGRCSRNAFTYDHVHGADGAAQYVSKWGVIATFELTHSHLKNGRAGRTPWQILADCKRGSRSDKALFREYAKAFKGARQLTWTRGLRETYELEEEAPEETLAEEPSQPETHVATIDKDVWKAMRQAGLTVAGQMVSVGEGNAADAFRAFLERNGIAVQIDQHASLEPGRFVPRMRLREPPPSPPPRRRTRRSYAKSEGNEFSNKNNSLNLSGICRDGAEQTRSLSAVAYCKPSNPNQSKGKNT